MSSIQESYGLDPVQTHVLAGLSKIVCPHVCFSKELVGIEVEVENAGNIPGGLNRVWTLTQDGSLRNNGIELITRPIQAASAPVALEYLLKTYLTQDCCFSPRTSVHVHLNMQDVTRGQAVDFILMYAIFERLYYKFTGRGRMKNIYCVPIAETDLLTYLCEYGETRDRTWSKYTGLNTLPLASFGTIEFRHMHGTFDVEKLTLWINLITKLKEYIKATPTKQIRSMIAEMDDGYNFAGLIDAIWGEYAKAFRYESPLELNYLQAKQALGARANIRAISIGWLGSSSFAKFKG